MDYSQIVENLNQDTIDKLTTAIEIGRWPHGDKLTSEQLESAMQAVMLWQAKHRGNVEDEPFVVGPNGELFTGKGESHKVAQTPLSHDTQIIIKRKV